MSLGAESGSMVRMLMKQGPGLVAVGGIVGLGASVVFARLLSGFLFGVEAMDPAAFIVVATGDVSRGLDGRLRAGQPHRSSEGAQSGVGTGLGFPALSTGAGNPSKPSSGLLDQNR